MTLLPWAFGLLPVMVFSCVLRRTYQCFACCNDCQTAFP